MLWKFYFISILQVVCYVGLRTFQNSTVLRNDKFSRITYETTLKSLCFGNLESHSIVFLELLVFFSFNYLRTYVKDISTL